MLFYVCGPNMVLVSCKSTALQRFTWNNFFDKNGRTWPQFDLYNFWPWVTLRKIFRECVELMPGEVLKISKRYSQPNLSYWRKPTRGPFAPPPQLGRVLNPKHPTILSWLKQWDRNRWHPLSLPKPDLTPFRRRPAGKHPLYHTTEADFDGSDISSSSDCSRETADVSSAARRSCSEWCRDSWHPDPGYMSGKIRKFRTDKFDTRNKRKFWLM